MLTRSMPPSRTVENQKDLPSEWSKELPKELIDEKVSKILAVAIARQATRFVSHLTTARVRLSTQQLKEGIKSRIVGKDGRNARYFEEQAGVNLILNDEPNAVIISCFDPFRREVARVALEALVQDGRIHAPRIEETLKAARVQIEQEVREVGSQAASALGLPQLHPAILRVVGTLKFRHSFGQNQLEHAIETAGLCGSLAAELGFDPILARRAGLLHDLGKGLDQTHDGGHAEAGAEFAERFGEPAEVVQAIRAHHEEVPPQSWLDHLVIAADALSGGRPGVRHGSQQALVERSEQMEKMALEFPGVTAAYAVQAGRELRVFIDQENISEAQTQDLARQIADRIQSGIQFPGQIKVTALREMRVVEFASR